MTKKETAQHAFIAGYMNKQAFSPIAKTLTGAGLTSAAGLSLDHGFNKGRALSSVLDWFRSSKDKPEVAAAKAETDSMYQRLLRSNAEHKAEKAVWSDNGNLIPKTTAEANTASALKSQDAKNQEDLKKYLAMALGGGLLVGGGAMAMARPAQPPKKKKKSANYEE